MKRVVVLVVMFIVLSFSEARSCSCAWSGPFVDYANKSEGVIRARIVGYADKLSHGETLFANMTVEVISVLKGKLKFKSIDLMGDPGMLCLDYVDSSIFVVGQEFLIALHSNEAVQSFGGCGEAWVRISGDEVSGVDWTSGKPKKYSVELDELVKALSRSMQTLQ